MTGCARGGSRPRWEVGRRLPPRSEAVPDAAAPVGEDVIERRNGQQRQQRRGHHPTDDSAAQWRTKVPAFRPVITVERDEFRKHENDEDREQRPLDERLLHARDRRVDPAACVADDAQFDVGGSVSESSATRFTSRSLTVVAL